MTIPSEYEKFSGEVFDPIDALDEIEKANHHLDEFIDDMRSGRNPEATLDSLASATDKLGLYAGYPIEASNMESYLKSDQSVSYREAAEIISEWLKVINALIEARIKYREKAKAERSDSDVPF